MRQRIPPLQLRHRDPHLPLIARVAPGSARPSAQPGNWRLGSDSDPDALLGANLTESQREYARRPNETVWLIWAVPTGQPI